MEPPTSDLVTESVGVWRGTLLLFMSRRFGLTWIRAPWDGGVCSRTGRGCWFHAVEIQDDAAVRLWFNHYRTSTTVADRDRPARRTIGLLNVDVSAQCVGFSGLDSSEWIGLLPWV